MWNSFVQTGMKIATPITSAGVAAKSKNVRAGEMTSNILKSITGGRVLNVTALHGNGLTWKVMWLNSFKVS